MERMAVMEPTVRCATANRRKSVRFPCSIHALVRPSGSSHSSGLWPGQIRDLSQNGVGLLLSRRFEPESRLIIELKDGLGEDLGMLLARVVRVAESSDTGWIMGCALINSLPESDVKFYLGAFLNC